MTDTIQTVNPINTFHHATTPAIYQQILAHIAHFLTLLALQGPKFATK